MSWQVYILVDPFTGDIRYVGGSNNPQRRLGEHLSEASTNRAKWEWLESLKQKKLKPLVMTIATYDTEKELADEEINWQRRLRLAGCNLFNHSRRRYSNSSEWMATRTARWKVSMEESKEFRAKWAAKRKKARLKALKLVRA